MRLHLGCDGVPDANRGWCEWLERVRPAFHPPPVEVESESLPAWGAGWLVKFVEGGLMQAFATSYFAAMCLTRS